MLSIVENKVRYDDFNKVNQFIEGLIILESKIVLLSDIAGQVADVLMTPWSEICLLALQEIIETGSGPFLTKDHR